jgi:LmbE family N-acetylglucosaminyl deacetylase
MPRVRLLVSVSAILAIFAFPAEDIAAARRQQPRLLPPPPQPPVVSNLTRLLVIAPHPDDEVLGAGGLMQQVHEAGGRVRVVYLTDGDGYLDGVRIEERQAKLAYKDFRSYGRRREHEALSALRALGLDAHDATFLSFPDTGLKKLIRAYWSDRRAAYRSPYTRRDRPPKSEWVLANTEYRGEDLTQELARVVGDYRPTLILVPRREDQHPDHCAAWYFLADALGDVSRVQPDFAPDVLNYIVHYNDWPFTDEGLRLPAPPGLRGGSSGWIKVALSPSEVRTKRRALRQYRTQVDAMAWFLDGFVRSNEVFSRPAPNALNVVLPVKHVSCE